MGWNDIEEPSEAGEVKRMIQAVETPGWVKSFNTLFPFPSCSCLWMCDVSYLGFELF